MNIKRLIVIDGAAGSGKSDLLEFISEQIAGHDVEILQKFTTRQHRSEEKRAKKRLDLKFVSEDDFAKLNNAPGFYKYTYPRKGGHKYGFYRSELEMLFQRVNTAFMIVRSAITIKKITQDFPDVVVIPLFVYTIETLVRERLLKDGHTEVEINFRLSRTAEAMRDFYTYPTLYQQVIINNSDKATYQLQLRENFEKLLAPAPSYLRINKRTHFHLPSVIQPFKEDMVEHLQKYPFDRNVFLMMKFRDSNKDTYELIKLILESNDYNCVRADMNEWSITKDDVYNPYAVLYCCKYGIALFDEPEPQSSYNVNVAIELAMMHMQNKFCLMLKHSTLSAPPFDLAAKIYKSYTRTEELVAIIKNWLTRLK